MLSTMLRRSVLGDAFFGNNHDFNETLFEEVHFYQFSSYSISERFTVH